jgi:serine protease Do
MTPGDRACHELQRRFVHQTKVDDLAKQPQGSRYKHTGFLRRERYECSADSDVRHGTGCGRRRLAQTMKIILRAASALPTVILACATAYAQPSQTSLASTYSQIKPSLALIAYRQGNDLVTGSSFCIANADGLSYFLTNAHVVDGHSQVDVFLASNPARPYIGNVIRVNPSLDAAIVAIRNASVPPLTIGLDSLPEGQPVAIAGYPSAHISFALAGLGLLPAVHEGIVTSYLGNGFFLEFDAQVEHGNSGGPVFDPDTGIVYALVTFKIGTDQTNLAISLSQLTAFIENTSIPITRSTRTVALSAARQTPPAPAQQKTVRFRRQVCLRRMFLLRSRTRFTTAVGESPRP